MSPFAWINRSGSQVSPLSSERPRLATVMLLPALTALLLLSATVLYYVNEVRVARNHTPMLVQEAFRRYGRTLKPSDLSSHRLQVLLAVEDPAFFLHHGVDLETPGAGMTTITQGLVKTLYFPEGFQQGAAKIRQTLIAQYALDALVPKEQQLELLLDTAYLGTHHGESVRGFSAAARSYFDKDFRALSDGEFQSLVAMLIAPNRLAPGTPAHAERMRRIDAYLAGTYRPKSVLDVDYDGRTRGSLGEELLMTFLRLVTDAKPAAGPHGQAPVRQPAVTARG